MGGRFVGTTKDIETLRPKSPGRNKHKQPPKVMMQPQNPYPYMPMNQPPHPMQRGPPLQGFPPQH